MRFAIVLMLLLSACVFLGASGIAPDPENLPNLQEPRYQLLTAGQPTETGFREIAAMGVKTVMNVLPEPECWTGEEAYVKEQRMNYVAFPFETSGFKLQTIERFGALLEQEEKPMLIHCSTGNHVGGLWFSYRILMEKAPLAVALKEARKIGLKPQLEDALLPWVMDQRDKMHGDENIGR